MSKPMMQRVVWNTDGWLRPSGVTTDNGWPAEHGFGHEEWNFQTADQLNGEIAGYVYYEPTEAVLDESGNSFDIGFFTRDPDECVWWYVGAWWGARLAEEETLQAFDDWYEENGIYQRRARELRSVIRGLTPATALGEATTGLRERWVRFVVPVTGVQSLPRSRWIRLGSNPRLLKLGVRFSTPTFVDKLPQDRPGLVETPRASETWTVDPATDAPVPLTEDSYLRTTDASQRVIARAHAELSNSLARWLKDQGCTQIRQEEAWVDVCFERGKRTYIAEIKVTAGISTRHAVREALGQLLEYNHYGWRRSFDRWWIVLDRQPTTEDRAYVEKLRSEYKFPLRLGWRHGDEFEFEGNAFEN